MAYLKLYGHTLEPKRRKLHNVLIPENELLNDFSLCFSEPPKFEIQPSDVAVFPGQVAIFECRIGNEPEQVIWLKNDRILGLNDRLKILPSGNLEISDAQNSDFGNYQCDANGLRSRSATLNLKPSDAGMNI